MGTVRPSSAAAVKNAYADMVGEKLEKTSAVSDTKQRNHSSLRVKIIFGVGRLSAPAFASAASCRLVCNLDRVTFSILLLY
jgi:hypothetical protein